MALDNVKGKALGRALVKGCLVNGCLVKGFEKWRLMPCAVVSGLEKTMNVNETDFAVS